MVHRFVWKQVKQNISRTVKWREQQQNISLLDFETLQNQKFFLAVTSFHAATGRCGLLAK